MEIAEFADLFVLFQANFAESPGDTRAEAFTAGGFVPGGFAQDFADFFLHAATVTASAALQAGFEIFLDAADDELRHWEPFVRTTSC